MTAVKGLYRGVSDFLAKYHIRGIYILIVLYDLVLTIINPLLFTVNNSMNLMLQVDLVGVISCGIT